MTSTEILKKNKELQGRNAGRPCFILGSGPSINRQDILPLKNETTIAANHFYKHPDCKRLAPDYWVCADPDIWLKRDLFLDPLLDAIEMMELNTKLFFPLHGLVDIRWSPFFNLYYFNYDYLRTCNDNIDFTGGIPPFGQNVILVCLMLALFLEANPIYLLGCDHSWWDWTRDDYSSKDVPHFFNTFCPPASDHIPFDQLQSTIRIQRYQYLQLLKYSQSRGISIFNATEGGYLDIFPRISFESIKPSSYYVPDSIAVIKDIPMVNRHLAETALELMNQERYNVALVLIIEAIRQNTNRASRINGLKYLEAVCLLKIGAHDSALAAAREDFAYNQENRNNSLKLITLLSNNESTNISI